MDTRHINILCMDGRIREEYKVVTFHADLPEVNTNVPHIMATPPPPCVSSDAATWLGNMCRPIKGEHLEGWSRHRQISMVENCRQTRTPQITPVLRYEYPGLSRIVL